MLELDGNDNSIAFYIHGVGIDEFSKYHFKSAIFYTFNLYISSLGGEQSIAAAYFLWLANPVFLFILWMIRFIFSNGFLGEASFLILNILLGYFWWFKVLPKIYSLVIMNFFLLN